MESLATHRGYLARYVEGLVERLQVGVEVSIGAGTPNHLQICLIGACASEIVEC